MIAGLAILTVIAGAGYVAWRVGLFVEAWILRSLEGNDDAQ